MPRFFNPLLSTSSGVGGSLENGARHSLTPLLSLQLREAGWAEENRTWKAEGIKAEPEQTRVYGMGKTG